MPLGIRNKKKRFSLTACYSSEPTVMAERVVDPSRRTSAGGAKKPVENRGKSSEACGRVFHIHPVECSDGSGIHGVGDASVRPRMGDTVRRRGSVDFSPNLPAKSSSASQPVRGTRKKSSQGLPGLRRNSLSDWVRSGRQTGKA